MTYHPKRGATASQAKPEAKTTKAMTQPETLNQPSNVDRGPTVTSLYQREFDHNPELAARHTLIDRASRLARMATPNSAVAHARVGLALYAIAESDTDDKTRGEVVEAQDRSTVRLACAPVQTLEDVQAKLAGLVLELVRFADGSTAMNPAPLMLAACALADLVILGDAPAIPLPRRVFEPIDNEEIVNYWRRSPPDEADRL